MWKIRSGVLLVGAALVLSSLGAAAVSASVSAPRIDASEIEEVEFDRPPTTRLQTEAQALQQDLRIVADAKGWTLREARADYEAAENVGELALFVAEKYPDVFVGSELSEEPGGPATLFIKGSANEEIREMIDRSPLRVTLQDRQPYSFWELEERSHRVHDALVEAGFSQVATGFDISERGVIRTGVKTRTGRSVGVERGAALEALAEIPRDLQSAVEITINTVDIVEDEHVYGGVRIDTPGGCTTGWTVVDGGGTTGVTTAGHCSHPKSNIVAPGEGNPTFVDEHRGSFGDVEWYTTNHFEPAEFYATATARRATLTIEAIASISQGESICQYGRSSNDRDCSLDVDRINQVCTNGGVTNRRLVLMDGDTGIPGDSGGGWSFSNRAYGGHKGNCADVPGQEVFSAAAHFPVALGVTVRTQ